MRFIVMFVTAVCVLFFCVVIEALFLLSALLTPQRVSCWELLSDPSTKHIIWEWTIRLSLPDFIPWGPGYESVYYGIINTRPLYSERAHRALQSFALIQLGQYWTRYSHSKTSKFSNKCMDCRTLVRKSIHFFANFEAFEWLYLVQYCPQLTPNVEIL